MYARNRRSRWWKRTLVHLMAFAVTLAAAGMLLVQKVSARTYVITDGDRIVTYHSFASDPAEVLGQMGLALGEGDSYTTEAVEGGAAITIQRAPGVTVCYHGQTTLVSGAGGTVGELLARLGLEVTGEDVVSHRMDAPVYDGMELRVDREVTVEEVYTKTLPHGTTRYSAPSIPAGLEQVLTQGADGEAQCVASVTYVNGIERRRRVRSETVLRAPKAEVIGVGTGDAAEAADPHGLPVIGDGYITLPTGEVLTYYKSDTVRATAYTHTDAGCDWITATGTTVRWGTVAVDPRYIPYGTRMFIMASDGSYVYGLAEAEDCGGDIKQDRMDLYMPTVGQCLEFGRRRCTVYFLG